MLRKIGVDIRRPKSVLLRKSYKAMFAIDILVWIRLFIIHVSILSVTIVVYDTPL